MGLGNRQEECGPQVFHSPGFSLGKEEAGPGESWQEPQAEQSRQPQAQRGRVVWLYTKCSVSSVVETVELAGVGGGGWWYV